MKQQIKLGVTDRTFLVYVPDPASTDGSGKTGLAHTSMTVSYTRVETDNDVIVTDVTSSLNALTNLTDAHNDWGWKEVSSTLAPGLYRLDCADAVFASGAWTAVVYVMITASAAAASPMEFILVAYDPLDTVRLGLTALPNAAAEAAGGLFTRGTGAGQIAQQVNGYIDVNIEYVNNSATAANNLGAMYDGTGYAGGTIKLSVDVGALSGDSAAADNAEAFFDGTGYKDTDNHYIIRTATAQAGASTTITLDASASSTDDFYNGVLCQIISGTGAGQSRLISDYVGSTKVATVATNWVVNPSSDSVFILWPAMQIETTTSLLSQMFTLDTGQTGGGAVPGSVVYETAATAVGGGLDAAGVRGAIGLASANLDTQLGNLEDPAVLVQTTIATLASQTSFTLTAGSADNSAYVGAIIVVTDQSTAVQKAVGLISAYTGSTRTVTLAANPGIFTMAVGDSVDIIADFSKLEQFDWADGGRLDLLLDAVKAKTDGLPSDPADASVLAALIAALEAKVDTIDGTASAILTDTGTDGVVVAAASKSGYSLTADFRIKKNTALAAFPFRMTQSADHVSPATGLTVTGEKSIDGGAFSSLTNSVTEIANGWYKVSFAAGDLNGDTIALKFTATGADQRDFTIITQVE